MNIKLTIEYDGSKYDGWQKNKNAKSTLQERIEETLSKNLKEDIKIIGAGRTDKGVHSKGMIANFHFSGLLNTDTLRKDLNHYLPADIYIREAVEVDERFHARFGAKSKTYVYRLGKSYEGEKQVFERAYIAEQTEPLDLGLMKKASQRFIGKHDFKGFSSDKTKKTTVREIFDIEIIENNLEFQFIYKGSGFLYHMIRIMTGTLIEIGEGRRDMKTINQVLESGVRADAGFLAPAKGLILEEVIYDEVRR